MLFLISYISGVEVVNLNVGKSKGSNLLELVLVWKELCVIQLPSYSRPQFHGCA